MTIYEKLVEWMQEEKSSKEPCKVSETFPDELREEMQTCPKDILEKAIDLFMSIQNLRMSKIMHALSISLDHKKIPNLMIKERDYIEDMIEEMEKFKFKIICQRKPEA